MIGYYKEKYNSQISNLLNSYPINWGQNAVVTLVSLDEGIVTGIGSLSKNIMHPYREYINIFVESDMRKKGIGKSIFNELLSFSDSNKLQTAISSNNRAAISFLEDCGFNRVRKSYTSVLKESITLNASDKKVDYVSFNNLTFEQKDEVIKLQLANYKKFHEPINPLSNTISFEEWKEIILEDLNQEHSYVLIKNSSIKAYIFCYEGDGVESIDIGYVGGKDTNKVKEYLVFYKQTLNHLFTKFKIIEIEADDVDSFAYALLNEFEYDLSESWDTYIYG